MLRPVSNPPNPWHSEAQKYLEPPPAARLTIFEERAKSIIAENDSPDVGFRFGVNPYRGCLHACAYCYARPSHQYLDFGAGTDFERKIVVKVNAPELLDAELRRKSWKGGRIAFSGNTDCYQPLEASYRLTRRCLETCLRHRNPVGIITKAILVRRDIDVLQGLTREADAHVHFSIPFADDAMARKVEPGTPAPSKRFEAMRALADAGIRVGVAVAPIIPGLNDPQVAEILERAKAAGATSAFRIMVRLPAEVLPVFFDRMAAEFPHRVGKIESAIREARGGRLNDPRFGARMTGGGARWKAIEDLFDVTCRRLGLNQGEEEERKLPPRDGGQLKLFGA